MYNSFFKLYIKQLLRNYAAAILDFQREKLGVKIDPTLVLQGLIKYHIFITFNFGTVNIEKLCKYFYEICKFLKICNYYALIQNNLLKERIVYVIIHVFHAKFLLCKKFIFCMRIKFMQESGVCGHHQTFGIIKHG